VDDITTLRERIIKVFRSEAKNILTCRHTNTEMDCWLYVIRTFIASHAEEVYGTYERLSKQQFIEYYALLPVVVFI
jgi:hypothetical protein